MTRGTGQRGMGSWLLAVLLLAGCGDDSQQGSDTLPSDTAVSDTAGADTPDGEEGGPPSVVINEVVADAPAGAPDWIEVFNTGTVAVHLESWVISDGNPDHNVGFSDTGALVLEPGAFAVLELPAALTWGFGTADCAKLHDPSWTLADQTCWETGAADGGRSWGRLPDGSGAFATLTPTQGAPNLALTTCGNGAIDLGEECDGAAFGSVSCESFAFASGSLTCRDCAAVSVASCVPHPSDVIINEVSSSTDGIELLNVGSAAVALGGLALSDRLLAVDRDYLLLNETLEPGAYLVVTLDALTPFRLGNSETLILKDAAGLVLDAVEWPVGAAAPSYCRVPNGSGDFRACSAGSLGAANTE